MLNLHAEIINISAQAMKTVKGVMEYAFKLCPELTWEPIANDEELDEGRQVFTLMLDASYHIKNISEEGTKAYVDGCPSFRKAVAYLANEMSKREGEAEPNKNNCVALHQENSYYTIYTTKDLSATFDEDGNNTFPILEKYLLFPNNAETSPY
ncbi:MAG: hypothetical protein LBG64_03870 [Pseudomonadales bacterium]|nr:hypothetical protein [Pseudomonadales bacterium]